MATIGALNWILSSLSNEVTNVLADQICLNIDFITNPTGAQIRVLESKRNNRDAKLPRVASVYCQAYSIDSNRPLGYQQ